MLECWDVRTRDDTSYLDVRFADIDFAQLLRGLAKCVRISIEQFRFLDEHID